LERTANGGGDGGAETEKMLKDTIGKRFTSTYAAGTGKQLYVLTWRNLLHYIRHPAIFWSQLVIHLLFAIITGSVFSNLKNKDIGLGENTIDLNTAAINFWNATFLILERSLYERERFAGMYAPLTYFLAKSLTETFFFSFTVLTYVSIVYPWVALRPSGFLYNLLTTITFVNVSLSAISAISAFAPNVDVAM
ncbi:hypothetical protein HK102_012728, partial [Quaeritorhiza haematococci]